MFDLISIHWMQLAQEFPQGVAWWVWIIPVVFFVFLLAGIWVRRQGKGVVTPEKVMIGAAAEPKSQPRPRPNAETPVPRTRAL